MLQNLKTKSKLSLLSLIALLGIIILGSLGIIQLKEVNNGLERVYNDRVVPLEQLKIIADEYAVNIVDTTHQTRNKNFQFDKCNKIHFIRKEICPLVFRFLKYNLMGAKMEPQGARC